ncbi:MAG: hypothetical protein K9H16_10865 [Bacteroidales bacterium]|nr:hypothetical protein [Bacteroidales bacterium]
MIIKIFEIARILAVSAAFYFGYSVGYENGYHPEAQLHLMIPIIIVAIAGISGLEGLVFGDAAAEAKGFEKGSNYQKQSAIALLSYAMVALFVFFYNWGIKSELTILFTFMFFFTFSAMNHGYDAVKRKNYKWANINRPFLTLLLIAGLILPVIGALKNI